MVVRHRLVSDVVALVLLVADDDGDLLDDGRGLLEGGLELLAFLRAGQVREDGLVASREVGEFQFGDRAETSQGQPERCVFGIDLQRNSLTHGDI